MPRASRPRRSAAQECAVQSDEGCLRRAIEAHADLFTLSPLLQSLLRGRRTAAPSNLLTVMRSGCHCRMTSIP